MRSCCLLADVAVAAAAAVTHREWAREHWRFMCLCMCFLQWITVSVHGSMELDFVLFVSKCEYWELLSVYENMQQLSTLHTISIEFVPFVAVVAVIWFWLRVFEHFALRLVGWLLACLLCLWYAKYDVFSHLLALRLFKCVGVFGTSIFRRIFFLKRRRNSFDSFPPFNDNWKRATFNCECYSSTSSDMRLICAVEINRNPSHNHFIKLTHVHSQRIK